MRRLANQQGVERNPDDARIRACLDACETQGFWLDIHDPAEEDFLLLKHVFGVHPLAIDEVRHNAIRPRLNEFDGYAFLVLGAAEWVHDELHTSAYHLFVAPGFLVTLHDDEARELDGLFDRLAEDPAPARFVAYLAVDSLIESLFPTLDELDRAIDVLQDRTMSDATPKVLAELHRVKHEVVDLHRMLGTQIDALQRLATHFIELHADELSMYFRNVYDHAVRQYEIVDSLRDLLTSAMDVYLSTVSNKLNGTMKQLTVIASLFLPLTFLTGFFGMNFNFLVDHISGGGAFAVGVSVMALTILFQLWLFRVRGWL